MQENVGTMDLAVRTVLAVILAGLAIAFAEDLLISALAALTSVLLAGTVLTRRCPLYHAFHFSTRFRTPSTGPRHPKL